MSGCGGEAAKCYDCEQALTVHDWCEYPSDTGPICFRCLKDRYESERRMRNGPKPPKPEPGPATRAVMDRLDAACEYAADDWMVKIQMADESEDAEYLRVGVIRAFVKEQEGGS